MDNRLLWYWFVNIPGIGLRTRHNLIDVFGHPRELWHLSGEIMKHYLTRGQLRSFLASRDPKEIRHSFAGLKDSHTEFLCYEDPAYPDSLRNIASCPQGLYLRGSLPAPDMPLVAVVGSRTPTEYGRECAALFSGMLAEAGVGIISGLAAGIDSSAHNAALKHGGYTLGVLGGGIDTMYPRNNFNLYMDMYRSGGVLSEYNLGIPNRPGCFPVRNRIISGLSDGILIVEAGEKSGSLITADLGLEQGKDIYAIPGRIFDRLSTGCNRLIRQGACPVQEPEEILEDLRERFPGLQKNELPASRENHRDLLRRIDTPIEKTIYSVLDYTNPMSPNEIKEHLRIDFSELLCILLKMEIKQLIRQQGQQLYVKLF